MKQWCLPNCVLDLCELWVHPQGPRVAGNEDLLSQMAWRSLRRRMESGSVGFFDLPTTMNSNLPSWEQKAKEIRSQYEGAILIGIGGSFWGTETILSALGNADSLAVFPLFWVTQPDPKTIESVKKMAGKKRLATIIISKSGNTVETLSAFYHLSHHLDPRGYVAITDPSSGELRELATREKWLALDIPGNVGGRYSVLSAVGLFPALLAGIPASEILTGARRMRDALVASAPEECSAFWMALSHFRWDQESRRPIHYLMPYSSALSSLSMWWVQLWAESLGKKMAGGKNVGFTPVAAMGPSDQHSLLQLFKEGPADKLIGFIDVKSHLITQIGTPRFKAGQQAYLTRATFEELMHVSYTATEKTLRNSGVPTYRLVVEHTRPETIGALLFFFETACALAGELYGVDAFGQPGVEEGKRILKDSLGGRVI